MGNITQKSIVKKMERKIHIYLIHNKKKEKIKSPQRSVTALVTRYTVAAISASRYEWGGVSCSLYYSRSCPFRNTYGTKHLL